jgi:hypothetical protein
MVTHSYNPNAQEAEAGEWQVLGRLGSAEWDRLKTKQNK